MGHEEAGRSGSIRRLCDTFGEKWSMGDAGGNPGPTLVLILAVCDLGQENAGRISPCFFNPGLPQPQAAAWKAC